MKDIFFEFTTPSGDTYIAEMTPTMALEEGTQYTFEIEFSKNPITVSATIEPWVPMGPFQYETLRVNPEIEDSEGAAIGDVITVYLQNEAGTDFDLLRTFTYESVNNWVPDSPVYWEDIEQDPALFRASMLADQPLNTTQLGDILIADPLSVARNSGAHFTLRHAASKVIVGLTSDTFTDEDLAGATITLPDYLTGGYEEKGQFIPGTQRMDIVVDRSDPASGMALFQPQTISGSDPLLVVTINGRDYEVEDTDGFIFEAGTAYQILVTVNKNELSASVSVVDWVTRTLNFEALTVGVTENDNNGVLNGEVLNVYTGDATTRTLLNSYTYYASQDSFMSPTAVYWESLNDPTTFYGSILRTPAYNSTQMDDYLVVDPVTVAASDGVHFEMKHAGSRVMVVLHSSDGTFSDDELAAMEMTLPDYITGGTVNNGVFVPGSGRGPIQVAKNVGTDGTSAIAFIQPQTIPAGTTVITVQSANRTYEATYPDDVIYAPNQSTTLRVDLRKTEISFSTTITDWTQQTVSMVAPSITINGQLGTTAEFFRNKSIYIYGLDPNADYAEYIYSNQSGTYRWVGDTFYWDDVPSYPVNLSAVYYPANVTIASNGTFPWSIGANQDDPANQYYDNYDLLMSNTGNLNAPTAINFQFKHVLSEVQINLIAGTGFEDEDLVGSIVTLPGYSLAGTAVLSTASVTTGNSVSTVTPHMITDGKEYMALVMPQTKAPNTAIVSVTVPDYPNTSFIGTLTNESLAFEAGKRTIINVTVQKTAIQLSATLAPWGNGDTGNIIIK